MNGVVGGMAVRKAFVVVAAGLVTLVAAATGRAAGPPSVAFQINVAHTGVQADPSLVPPFYKRWQVRLPGRASFPIIAQGNVYETVDLRNGDLPTVYALDQSTGQTVWSRTFAEGSPINSAYDGGRLFVVSNDGCCTTHGVMHALDAATGALLWTAQLPGQYEFVTPPVASEGVVYQTGLGGGGTLYAVDEVTGALLASQYERASDGTPALSDTTVFGSNGCYEAYAFSRQTLSPLYEDLGLCFGPSGLTPAYADGRLFVRNGLPPNLIFDAATGAAIRTWGPNIVDSAPAVDSSTLYRVWVTGLVAEDSATGAVKWTFAGDGTLSTSPIVLANGSSELVIEGSNSGNLYALDAATGGVVWTTDLGQPIPYPLDGTGAETQSGLGAGEGLLVVPAGVNGLQSASTVFAFAPVPATAKSISMGPQAMEGDLKVTSGTTLNVGYDFTMPGRHPDATVQFLNGQVTFHLTCIAGTGPQTITVPVTNSSYTDPAGSSAWYPSGDKASPLTYQGSITIPYMCDDGPIRLQQGGTFTASVVSTDLTDKLSIRWHYSANGSAGKWSGTLTIVPGS